MKKHRYISVLKIVVILFSILVPVLKVSAQGVLTQEQIDGGYYVKDNKGIFRRVIWEKEPIQIGIPYQKERSITFDNPVEVKISRDDFAYLRIMTVGNTTYWMVRHEIPAPIRLQVVDQQTGEIFIVDVSQSDETNDLYPIEIVSSTLQNNNGADLANKTQYPAALSLHDNKDHPYAILTRYAAQHFYGPRRLIEQVPGIEQLKIDDSLVYESLFAGGEYRARPVAAWKYDKFILTAIELTNLTSKRLVWNPKKIRAEFNAISPQHQVLSPYSSDEDSTIAYLITERSFSESINSYVEPLR